MKSITKNKNNVRLISLKVWKLLFIKKKKLSDIFQNEQSFLYLNVKDRSFVYFLIHIAIRNSNQIKFILKKFVKKKIDKNLISLEGILALGTSEIIWARTPDYAVLNSYVNLTKDQCGQKYSGFINAVLQNIVREKEMLSSEKWDLKNNYPKWLISNWEKSYGIKDTRDIINMFNKEPYLDLICSEKMSSKSKLKLIDFLNGIEIYPNVIRSDYKGKIKEILYYEEGIWWIQDLGSYIHIEFLISEINNHPKLQDKKCFKIFDLCAAPGGKTFQLIDNNFQVTSNDVNEKRLNLMIENLKRLQFNVNLLSKDGRNFKFKEKQDIIIIDAPCSSTGTIRKNPDILIRNNNVNHGKLKYIQNELLINSSLNLKIGGLLMYIVCSLEKEEGEDIINKFLKQNKNFKIIKFKKFNSDLILKPNITSEGFLRLLPNYFKKHKDQRLNGNNGFFSTILVRMF